MMFLGTLTIKEEVFPPGFQVIPAALLLFAHTFNPPLVLSAQRTHFFNNKGISFETLEGFYFLAKSDQDQQILYLPT